MAEWECWAMYTLDPRVLLPVSKEQLSLSYDYTTEYVLPCLAELGYHDLHLPSREVYIANDGYWEDHPNGSEAEQVCPYSPPTWALIGEAPPSP